MPDVMLMFSSEIAKPKQRSKLRLWLGRRYYALMRYGLWYSGRQHFAKSKQAEPLAYTHFEHATILLRELKDVDMLYQHNKVINLKLAAPRVDGVLIGPGETFSLWRLVGNPNARRGYVPGMVLNNGGFGFGVGGGLCQLFNLLYWMALHTELKVVERYRHSYDVFPDSNRTQPFGSGATCVYPHRDLMLHNDTAHIYQINVKVGATHLKGRIGCDAENKYAYEIVEKNHLMRGELWGGYTRHNELFRKRFDAVTHEFIAEEYVTENHALMTYVPFLEQTI